MSGFATRKAAPISSLLLGVSGARPRFCVSDSLGFPALALSCALVVGGDGGETDFFFGFLLYWTGGFLSDVEFFLGRSFSLGICVAGTDICR